MDIKLLVCPQSFSNVQFFVTPWTVAHQAPISMGFSRQEYWSGLPFPTAGDLLDPVIEHESLASPAMAGRFFTTVPPGKIPSRLQVSNLERETAFGPTKLTTHLGPGHRASLAASWSTEELAKDMTILKTHYILQGSNG